MADNSALEVTIYHRAIPRENEEISPNSKVDKFSTNVRNELDLNRKISTSSEEFMDTSDEIDQDRLIILNLIL